MTFKPNITPKKWDQLQSEMKSFDIRESDLEERFILAGGRGGQKVNKTHVKVQLKHLPSGISVQSDKTRSRDLNRYYARKQLCAVLRGCDDKTDAAIQKKRKQKAKRHSREKNKIKNKQ